ncbi:hypothetical protein GCM10010910_00970 [Microbacterium nanhaiense]|uniref:Uncharacterized protein n=1 Tax=Microbacterium nanhaiense TaxID=1301026 RepID=A0ABQ2MUH7_9MICO|nr:hypothetical protein [Microbacterium nanhaiense]GGO59021.1 hypothetical protein GCM10010910_00970 [Microbacterium nanhaiense]
MQTIGLHIGAGIDAMVSEPTPIGDEAEKQVRMARAKADIMREIALRTPPAEPSRFRRVLSFFGLADD